LTGALEDTDDDPAERWFSYPLAGTPAPWVHLARADGGGVVSVRIEGDINQVLAARLDTLLDLR
jgi:hypothetical protein